MWSNTPQMLPDLKPTFITIDGEERKRTTLQSIFNEHHDDEDLIEFLATMENGEDYQEPVTGIVYIKIPSWISQTLPSTFEEEDDFTTI
jgi:hypothetical protein